METRQFGKLTHQFWGLHTIPDREFCIGSVVSHPLRVECLWLIENREYLLAWHIFWLSFGKLDNAMLHSLLPLGTHGFIQNPCVDEGHFWRCMGHPLLHHEQTHTIVHQFYPLCMSESMESEVKEFSFLISNVILCCKSIRHLATDFCIQRLSV